MADTKPAPWKSSRKYRAFLVTCLNLQVTLVLATVIKAPMELAGAVLYCIVLIGGGVVLGQSGVDAAVQWASTKKRGNADDK